MNAIEELSLRYKSLRNDIEDALINAIKILGGDYYFVEEEDLSLAETDDLSKFDLPVVDSYSFSFCNYGEYYVTALVVDEGKLEIYGVNKVDNLGLDSEIELDYVVIPGLLDILKSLPDSTNDNNHKNRKMSLDKLYCPQCGSANIEVMAWVDANTHEYHSNINTPIEEEDTWCNNCEEHAGAMTLKQLWDKLSEVPINNNDEIEEDFMCFPAGTDRLDVWHWFDDRCENGLSDLQLLS